jgi:hypothetical protein
MQKNQRKNRPKKKEVSQEKWDEQLENLKRQYEHGGKRKEEVQPSSGNSTEK